jgi:hypothetical protein
MSQKRPDPISTKPQKILNIKSALPSIERKTDAKLNKSFYTNKHSVKTPSLLLFKKVRKPPVEDSSLSLYQLRPEHEIDYENYQDIKSELNKHKKMKMARRTLRQSIQLIVERKEKMKQK